MYVPNRNRDIYASILFLCIGCLTFVPICLWDTMFQKNECFSQTCWMADSDYNSIVLVYFLIALSYFLFATIYYVYDYKKNGLGQCLQSYFNVGNGNSVTFVVLIFLSLIQVIYLVSVVLLRIYEAEYLEFVCTHMQSCKGTGFCDAKGITKYFGVVVLVIDLYFITFLIVTENLFLYCSRYLHYHRSNLCHKSNIS